MFNVLFSSEHFDVYGIETRSNPDISGLAFRVGNSTFAVPRGCLGRDRHISTFLGLVQGGRKWLPSVMAVAQGAEGRDGELGQNAMKQAKNSPEHQDSHLQKEPRDILWPRAATLAPQFLHLKK